MSAFLPVGRAGVMSRCAVFATLAVAAISAGAAQAESSVTLGGFTLVNKGLVGVGRLRADLRDKLGETFGSGSGMAVDPKSWTRVGASYRGTFYLLPDRGYNVTGTIDYRAAQQGLDRFHADEPS
jgi:hypothetical protein